MLKKKKLVALLVAAAGILPVFGCLGDLPISGIADWLTIIDHFEGKIPGF